MKIILGGRASGKTTKLIQESAETGRRILTHNKEAARGIWWQAQSLGYDIPIPLTVMDLKPGTRAEIKKQGILIDDIETTLSALCGATVHTATYKCEDTPLITIDSQGKKMEQIDIHKLSAVEVEEVIEIHEAWKNFCKTCSKCPLRGAIFSCEVAFAIQYIKNKNRGIDSPLQPKFKQRF